MDILSAIALHLAKYDFTKEVNKYLNRYSNIRMGIRIIFEYLMVNDIIFPTVTHKTQVAKTNDIAIYYSNSLNKIFQIE